MPYSKCSYSCCKVQGCFFWYGDIKCYHIVSISRFCIQTNNILFVTKIANYLHTAFVANKKKLPGNHLSGSFFCLLLFENVGLEGFYSRNVFLDFSVFHRAWIVFLYLFVAIQGFFVLVLHLVYLSHLHQNERCR